jgi:CRISPR-associated protein Csh2
MGIVKNRSELIFLYDVKDANPNGDPLDENKPRIDEETGINLVTDVRLKRTIRDYLHDFKGEEIFVREVRTEEGQLKTKEDRLDDLKISSKEDLLRKCVDIRLFGATAAIKDKTIIFTGPVQFKLGRSLHAVNLTHMKGTTVMPSKEAKKQGTFTEQYVLPYSLICFYGIINENAAKTTQLTDDDVQLLLDGMWNGTKNLISRSKAGQVPRLLIKVNYSENNYHIGDLNNMIKLISEIPDEEIRDISQVKLDVSEFMGTLKANGDRISDIDFIVDDRVSIVWNGKERSLTECFENARITANKLKF